MDDDQENHKKLPLIKIKIQKYVQEEKVDPIIGSRSNDGPRVCNVCNKGFGSGKALGGHMRVHAQAHKERSPNNDHSNGEESDRTSCSICRKKIPSMKSLFGHMRCHPEREWRGIQPPAPATTASATSISGPSDDLNGTIDLAKSLPSWPSTDRRGRQALICCHDSSTLSEVEEEERIREAVHDLMRLARGESLHQVEATNSNSPTNRAEIGEYFSVKKPKIDERGRDNLSGGTGRVVIVKNLDRGKGKTDDGEEEGPNVNYNLGEKVKIMIKKKRKKMKLINLDSVSTPPERYKCSTCNKCFSTHQALGGHRSSHNKIKNDEDEHNANNVPTLVDEVASKEIIEGGGISSYKCKICNKSFSTGQALGGHKRSHWSGPVEDPASQSETGRRILGFDLNEVPRMDDEEVGGCGYHDPSSSYNSTS